MFFDQPQNRMSFMDVPKWNNITAKGQTNSKWYFEADVSSKKWTNKFIVDLFSFVFWKKVVPKWHFEINWPLEIHNIIGELEKFKSYVLSS